MKQSILEFNTLSLISWMHRNELNSINIEYLGGGDSGCVELITLLNENDDVVNRESLDVDELLFKNPERFYSINEQAEYEYKSMDKFKKLTVTHFIYQLWESFLLEINQSHFGDGIGGKGEVIITKNGIIEINHINYVASQETQDPITFTIADASIKTQLEALLKQFSLTELIVYGVIDDGKMVNANHSNAEIPNEISQYIENLIESELEEDEYGNYHYVVNSDLVFNSVLNIETEDSIDHIIDYSESVANLNLSQKPKLKLG